MGGATEGAGEKRKVRSRKEPSTGEKRSQSSLWRIRKMRSKQQLRRGDFSIIGNGHLCLENSDPSLHSQRKKEMVISDPFLLERKGLAVN